MSGARPVACAEAACDPGPCRRKAILGRRRWDADVLRDIVREYALKTPAVLAVQIVRLRPAACARTNRNDQLS